MIVVWSRHVCRRSNDLLCSGMVPTPYSADTAAPVIALRTCYEPGEVAQQSVKDFISVTLILPKGVNKPCKEVHLTWHLPTEAMVRGASVFEEPSFRMMTDGGDVTQAERKA